MFNSVSDSGLTAQHTTRYKFIACSFPTMHSDDGVTKVESVVKVYPFTNVSTFVAPCYLK